jgi:hypothetical protein
MAVSVLEKNGIANRIAEKVAHAIEETTPEKLPKGPS